MKPFVSTHYNYRDHRKIFVIDGRVGFTGGINLADEYINVIEKHGRWKDAACDAGRRGRAHFTALFLQLWNIMEQSPDDERFLPHLKLRCRRMDLWCLMATAP